MNPATAGTINKTLDVGDGTLTAGALTMATSGNNARDCILLINNGTATITGNITMNSAATRHHIDWTGSGTLYVGGNMTGGGLTTSGSGTVVYNGIANQTAGGAYSYDNLEINNSGSSAIVTVGGNATIGGTLTVTQGNVAVGAFTVTVTGTTSLADTLSFSSTTGTKTFSDIVMNSGGAFLYTVAETFTINGDVIMNGAIIDGTATGILTVSGNLNVPSGINTLGRGTITVTDSTIIDSTLNITSATGTKTFAGPVVLTSGGVWDNSSANSAIVLRGGITNDGTFTSGTGTYTFNTTLVQQLGGTSTITFDGAVTITGVTVTNNNVLFVNGNLTGTGGLTQATDALLYLGGNTTITTMTATANPNTVSYIGTGAQTIKGTTYHDLVISNNPGTASLGANTTVNNDLTVSSGGTMTVGAFTFDVSGLTDITGTFNITSATGTKTFNDLTVNGGGTWNNSGNEAVTINGNIVNDGTFTSGTGIYTLAGTSKTLSGSSALTISNVTVTGSYTNDMSFTAAASLAGSGTFTQEVDASLTIGNLDFTAATVTVATFNASASGNTVDYADLAAQTIVAPSDGAYHHLKASTLSAKTAAGSLTVNGDFTLQGSATFNGGTSNTHTFYGNWLINTGAATPFSFTTSSTIRFQTPTPAASTSISGSTTATLAFNNLEVNNTSGFEVFNNISATGNLTVGSGATIIPFESITVGGTGTLTGGGNVKVTRTAATADFVSQYTITNRDLSALTVDYDASDPQEVNALNYFNLIIRGVRGANNVTLNSGTVGISGTFSPIASFTSGGYVTTGNTVDFNATTAQSVPAFNYNDLTISNTRTTNNVTLASSGTIGIAGTFSPTASFTSGSYVTTGSTVNYNGSGAQSVAAFDYHHLSLSTGGTKTLAAGTTRVAGNFAVNNPATADATTNSSTIEYNGSSMQTTPAVAYSSLTLNNASGIQLSGSASIAGTLTLTSGNITTNANTLSIASTGTVSRTSGHIIGNFQKFIPTGTPSRTFEIGSGTNYTPVDAAFAGVSSSGDLTVSTTGTDHPQILLSGIDGTKSANRYWTLTNSGIVFTSYDATFNFVAGDVDGGANTSNFIVSRYDAGSWTQPTVGTITGTSTQATGLTGFGDFQLGEASAGALKTWDGGAATNNWSDGDNWNPNGVPTSTDDVNLSGAVTVDIDTDAEANSMTVNNGGLVVNILSGQSLTLSGNLSLTGGTFNTAADFPTVTGTTNISGGTVGFTVSSGNQNVPALSYNNLTFSGGGTRTLASGTTQIGAAFTVSGPTVDATTNSTIVDFNGSSQTVPALSYYNLTFSGTGTKSLASGTTGIANTLTVGGLVTVDATTNSTTLNYNGSGAQTVRAIIYHHLTLSNSGTKTFASGTTEIRGNFTVSGATADATTNSTTITFNGSGAQDVAAASYYNLTFDNSGTKTFVSGTSSISNVFTVTGSAAANATTNSTTIQYNGSSSQNVAQIDYHHLTLTTDGVKTFAAGTTNIAGNFTINSPASANVTTNSATIRYNGSSLQTTPVLSYVGLTIDNTNGIQLSGDVTIAGSLTFTSGNIQTGANKITITSTGSVSRTSGHVVGNFEKYFAFNFGVVSRTFEVGSGSTYAPVIVDYTNVLTAGYLIVSTAAGDHAQIVTSGIDDLQSVNRTWTLTNNGIVTSGSYSAVFNFVAGDIDASADPNIFIAARYSGGAWTTPTVGTRTATSTQVTGVTGYGDYQLGEAGTSSLKTWDGGAGTSNWGDGDNWSPNGVPLSTNNVQLNGAHTININVAAVGNSVTLNHASLVLTILSGNSLTADGTLTLSNGTLNTEADFPTAADTVITGGTVGYTASSGTQTVAEETYNNLTISGGGTKSLATNITIAGDLTISGGSFELDTFTANRTAAGGTLTLANGSSLKIGGTGGIPANFSTHSIGVTSTIEYAGGNQTIEVLNSSQDYGNLTVSGTGTKILANNIDIVGDLTISASTLDLGTLTANRTASGGTLTLGATASLLVGGSSGGVTGSNFPANFTTFALSGTTEYDGSSAQTIANATYGNLVFSNSGAKSINDSFTVQGYLTVSSGASASVGMGVVLQVNGDVNLVGGFTNDGTVNVGN